jgi:integrase
VIWRAEHGSIGGASVRLKPREPADASGHESTRFAVVPAGRAPAVFHRAGVRDVLRADRRAGGPLSPRNVNRWFDARCKRYGVRRITVHDTRGTCGSLLAALDVHPRVAMAILRHSRMAMTMEIYTQVPDKATRDALRRLSAELDEQSPATEAAGDDDDGQDYAADDDGAGG